MRAIQRIALTALAAGLLLPIASCASGDYDSSDGADVVLLVSTIPQIPEIQTSFDATSNTCVFTVPNLSVTLENRPKSPTAGTVRPANDIVLETVTVSYIWDTPTIVTQNRTFAIGGTIAAGGSASVSFPPIAGADLNPSVSGHTATSVLMLFRGHTVTGDAVSAIGNGASLSVRQCPACQDTDGDGICDSSDNCLNIDNVDQADADFDSIGDLCDPCPQNPDPLCGP